MKTFFTLIISIIVVYNTAVAQQQIQNPDFEQWEDVGLPIEEPVNWSSIKTTDDIVINGFAPEVWGKSTDAHSGNYSLHLFNVYNALINTVATGTVTNGRLHPELNIDSAYTYTDTENEQWHSVLTERPDSVVGWYKCNPLGDDFGTVKFVLHTGYCQLPGDETNHIAIAYYELPSEVITEWTRFSAPFVYTSSENPEYVLSILTAGYATTSVAGSTALFDDLEFVYNESSIDELSVNIFGLNANNGLLTIRIDENNHQDYDFILVDINGRIVIQNNINSGVNNFISVAELTPGIYIATAVNSEKKLVKKILIN